jgi:hypothetical protein
MFPHLKIKFKLHKLALKRYSFINLAWEIVELDLLTRFKGYINFMSKKAREPTVKAKFKMVKIK